MIILPLFDIIWLVHVCLVAVLVPQHLKQTLFDLGDVQASMALLIVVAAISRYGRRYGRGHCEIQVFVISRHLIPSGP